MGLDQPFSNLLAGRRLSLLSQSYPQLPTTSRGDMNNYASSLTFPFIVLPGWWGANLEMIIMGVSLEQIAFQHPPISRVSCRSIKIELDGQEAGFSSN